MLHKAPSPNQPLPAAGEVTPGALLRHWRKLRGWSQMDLALEAEISTRHLSFVETGRSRPGYPLLLRLAEVLQLPLRETNTLLVAAGYAPHYPEGTLDDDRTGLIRAALERTLRQHEPYPALVLNRCYDILLMNSGAQRLLIWLNGTAALPETNLFRLIFAPGGLLTYFVQPAAGALLLQRLHAESATYQSSALAKLYVECRDYYALAQAGQVNPDRFLTETASPEPQLPLMTLKLQRSGLELAFFSTVMTFGTAIDVTVQELKIESFFPADPATRQFFEAGDATRHDK